MFAKPEDQLSEAVRLWNAGDTAGALRSGRRAARRLPIAKVVVAQWLMLDEGNSTATDEAIGLLKSAVEDGSHEAMQVLGACYLFGEGVEKDPSKTLALTRRRADEGDVEAQIAMVRLLTLEEYLPPDVDEALRYATLAAEQGRSEILAALVKDAQADPALKTHLRQELGIK